MTHTMQSRLVAIALGAAMTTAALAQPTGYRQRNGVNWLSGGVSLEERDAMRDIGAEYNLQIVFAMSGSGEYRADVPVWVEDQNGNAVLSIVTDGPWLFAKVPPGHYRVRSGDGQESAIDVGTGRSVVYFHSPIE